VAKSLKPNYATKFTISNDSGVIAGCLNSLPLEQSLLSIIGIRPQQFDARIAAIISTETPKVNRSKGGLFESQPKILDLKLLLLLLLLYYLISVTSEYSSRIVIIRRGGTHLSELERSPHNTLH
jgi:hypothetical protein